MSRWGEDNFDSDISSDYLTFLVYQLLNEVEKCLNDEQRENDDAFQCGESRLMPSVDILITLAVAYPSIVTPIFDDLPINEWKIKYLKLFDEGWVESGMDDNSKSLRRKVIVDTFAKFEDLKD